MKKTKMDSLAWGFRGFPRARRSESRRRGLRGRLERMEPVTVSLFSVLALCTVESSSRAQDSSTQAANQSTPAPASEPSAGLVPVPDYTGGFWTRRNLSGDWGGLRTDLANKGVQFGIEWNQHVQGVVDGGRDRTTHYGGTVDYNLTLDLMRMGVMKGALVKFRAESRYGRSVNVPAGTVLPINTDLLFPLTDEIDEDIPITITSLNYMQFLSEHLGVLVGKIDTLDGDPNEFASGRGMSQFLNANFIFNLAMALRLPYSTLAGGLIWMPVPVGPDGGITVSSMIMNTADASTTTGFNDFGDGLSWSTEVNFQYRLGGLPGGMNLGLLYSFDQDFAHLKSGLVFAPGEGLSVPTDDSTWAAYWSGWQYLFSEEPTNRPIDIHNGQADLQGVGLFARFGFADEDTNPIEWAVSGGIGGRGVIPSRDNDTFGLGYYYSNVQEIRLLNVLGAESSTQGFEAFYQMAITPAFHVTLDVQVVEPASESLHTATILGLRAGLSF